jgi:arachidonate 15-lipoxygenase
MIPLLSQNDPNIAERQVQLAQTQSLYQYNYTYFPPIAMAEKVPEGEGFTLPFLIKVGEQLLQLFLNSLATALPAKREQFKASHDRFAARFVEATLKQSESELVQLAEDMIVDLLEPKHTNQSGANIQEYNDLFSVIPLPSISKNFKTNSEFARLRVAGFNPLVIKRVQSLDARFPLTEAQYQTVLPNDSLAAAGAEGRLYLANYAELSSAQGGTFPLNLQKYVSAPLALFAVPKGGTSLTPIAIQCGQVPSLTNPIFLCQKDEEPNWMLAKTVVEIADANFHEAISHLGRCHMFMEPFAIATPRQLAANHPLFILLKPHFQTTLAINDAAQSRLIAPGGVVDKLLAGTIKSSRAICVQGTLSYKFNESFLPEALKHRGVDDQTLLPDYPYRDDALLVWESIHNWVKAYLSIYYHSDSDVINDSELQAWAKELVAQDGGRVVGFAEDGEISTLAYLIDAVTMIIFTASAQHASVNFPQNQIMSYVPAAALAGYAPAPTQTTGATEADFFAMLPPISEAELQLQTGFLLGSVHYTTLGDYDQHYFTDDHIQKPLQDFQDSLKAVESTIKTRNESRSQPYEFLLPSKIPQSINI